MIVKPFAVAMLLSIPAACQTSDDVVSFGGPDACGASSLEYLVGQTSTSFQTMEFEGPIRVIRPGDAVTMDYNPERLNIDLDSSDIISTVRCG